MSEYTSTPPGEVYEVRPVSSKVANEMVVKYHYLHRRVNAMFCWGMYEGDRLMGVIMFGKGASPTVCRGVCGPEEAPHVIELTRLYCRDEAIRNSESWLIGQALKLLPPQFDIVISYADTSAGHSGLVYRATNFLYTGKSVKAFDWCIDGDTKSHPRGRFTKFPGGIPEARKFYGDRMKRVERARKNRYVYLRGATKKRRKELRRKLRWTPRPYECIWTDD